MRLKKLCKTCGSVKDITSFYGHNKEYNTSHWCKSCFNKYQMAKAVSKKKTFVRFLGNKCKRCGITHTGRNTPIFDFHHTDASTKDGDWSRFRHMSLDNIRAEMKKCILLCSNCHRMHHHRQARK